MRAGWAVVRGVASAAVTGAGLLVVLVVLWGLWSPKTLAQTVPAMAGYVSGATLPHAVPAYLKSCNYTATTTGNVCHAGPTVLGCVVINTAGAAGSTIKLYNGTAASVGSDVIHETIDATQVGRQFCYGKLFTGGLVVAVASSGAAPDATVTYQGR